MIRKEVYEKLLQCPSVPPEIGGILGGKKCIIEKVIIDIGKNSNIGIKYIPDVLFLNSRIAEWSHCKVDFYGIFHTHSRRWTTLSFEDKKYIELIMRAMPDEVKELFFPLVIPKDIVKAFRAVKTDEKIDIIEEEINII